MVDYRAAFKASLARVTDGARQQSFFDGFYDRFIASDPEIEAHFQDTDFTKQKLMLRESLAEMKEFCDSLQSNPYIVTLARIHGVRGRNISVRMFDVWLDCLVATVKDIDPDCTESVELAWRIVMAPGIEFMKFYRDR